MKKIGSVCLLIKLGCAFHVHGFDALDSAPPVDEILKRMQASEQARQQAFQGYTSTRSYVIENPRFHVRATMRVELTVDASGRKHFRVLERTGPSTIHKMVFQRMLDTEARASMQQETTRVSPDNYSFRLAGAGTANGRDCFILEATPKTSNPLLFRGKVWVDSVEYAVVRVQGSPAQNPSFWIRKASFEHIYKKNGQLWLAASNRSETEVKMFGRTTVQIDYGDYTLSDSSMTREAVLSVPPD